MISELFLEKKQKINPSQQMALMTQFVTKNILKEF